MDALARAALFREVNDRIYDLTGRECWDGDAEFLCECGADCGCRVPLARAVFESLRRRGRPVLAEGCERSLVAA